MKVFFGAIADDFTGAADLAGLLARSGYPVNLRLGCPGPDDRPGAEFEIIALKCRTAPVEEAVRDVVTAAKWLKNAGAERFFWKYCSTFDSTAKGNIGPVAEALMDLLTCSSTIYCPAFPENGRSIYMGNLFVGDQLLSESPMQFHPLTPMQDASLVRLLEPQTTRPATQITWPHVRAGHERIKRELQAHADAGKAHIVIDAIDGSDLDTIARACHGMRLLTGGSALAQPLPAIYAANGHLSERRDDARVAQSLPGQLVLAGSCSSMTRRQIDEFKRQAEWLKIDPIELAADPGVLDTAKAWLLRQDPDAKKLVFASDEPESVRAAQEALGVDEAGRLVEDALSQLALFGFEIGIRRFVVAGGETSGAVVKAFAIAQLAIGQEIAPGVPWTFGSYRGQPLALALKSGNFGAESFFQDALEML